MGKSKRKNYHPSSLQELEPDLRIISSITFRDILWKEGDLVSVLEDDEEYYAQVVSILIRPGNLLVRRLVAIEFRFGELYSQG